MKRRRFLSLTAAFACAAPGLATAATWRGIALGADASLTLTGPRSETQAALAAVPGWLDEIERLVSLYRPSTLTHLNRDGAVRMPPLFARLVAQADHAFALTGGLFDPTVQPLWRALAEGRDPAVAQTRIGWQRLERNGGTLRLGKGQALTFNGIAQGFATDVVTERLAARGFTRALIEIGEARAMGGPYRMALSDPSHGALGTRSLTNAAMATSSPAALRLGDRTHILGPHGQAPKWSTIGIVAATATQADALSTAAVFTDKPRLERLKREAELTTLQAVDTDGNLSTI